MYPLPSVRNAARSVASLIAASFIGILLFLVLALRLGGGAPPLAAAPSEATEPQRSDDAVIPSASTQAQNSDGADQFVASLRWVAPDTFGRWTSDGGDGRRELPWTTESTTLRLEFGRLVASTLEGNDWVFAVADEAGNVQESFRMPGMRASLDALASPDGTTLFFHVGTGDGDGGVYAVDLATHTVHALVKPNESVQPTSRIKLVASPTGRTIASSLCGFESCSVDVVDVASVAAIDNVTGLSLVATTDQYVMGTDGPHGGWLVFNRRAGAVQPIAQSQIEDGHEAFPLSDTVFLLSGWTGDEYVVVAADVEGGSVRAIATLPTSSELILSPLGWSPEWAILSSQPVRETVAGGQLTLLELSTGRILEDPVPLRP